MLHHTKHKGDIAVTKAIAELTLKGYLILAPGVCEHSPFDFVAYKYNKL
ncbi:MULTISPECIES: group I intron-associated PD-(D/E)XK endonuclease [unclassified Anabaena]|nr:MULTISPECIES: group I intron-associated PD-(D/E)XK endonuclease [unclassified Anabaena]